MIAKNFMKYPEALRFQRELFSNGYHNSPRIMRLMECVFDWTATVPNWWKEAKGRARDLAKRVRKSINDFFKDMAVKASDQLSLVFEAPARTNHTTARLKDMICTVKGKGRYNRPDLYVTSRGQMTCAGTYRRFCPTAFHALGYTDGMNYSNERNG
jgi:hypothetical protein